MNKEKKLVGGIIGRTGRGAYGHKLDLGFYRSESIKIGAVADENSSGLREAMNRLNCQNGYSDWRKMIFEESLDFVVVAPRFVDCHEEMVITCLEADLHVYCEKPLAQDLAQADRMVAAAAARGLVLGNALPWRIEPRLNQVRKIIRDGNIGAIKHVSAECKCDKRGGGEDFLILGLHFADLMREFLGNAVSTQSLITNGGILTAAHNITEGGEEIGLIAGDSILATWFFETGTTATLKSVNYDIIDRTKQPYQITFHGTKGCIIVRAPYADHCIHLGDTPFPIPGITKMQKISAVEMLSYDEYHKLMAEDFAKAIFSGSKSICSGSDGRSALEMIHSAYVSHFFANGGRVTLPLKERSHPLAKAKELVL